MRLLRFLRGHKMNVSVAATKYREMLEFRGKYQMDLIRDAIAETNMPLEEIPNFQKIMCVALFQLCGSSQVLILLRLQHSYPIPTCVRPDGRRPRPCA